MTTSATMLDAHPHLPELDTQLHADTLDALWDAARVASQCADACLYERDRMQRCISLDLDVVDVAAATAGVLVRTSDPSVVRQVLVACRSVLATCAQECREHGAHLRHCALCAEACERAEEQCLRLEVAVQRVIDGGTTTPRRVPAGGVEIPEDLDITTGRGGRPPIHLIAGDGPGEGAD